MKKEIIVIVVIIILILLGWWFWTSKNKEMVAPEPQPTPQPTREIERPKPVERLTLKHQYNEGTHTLNGTIDVQNDCHEVDYVTTYDSDSNTVLVEVTSQLPEEGAVCSSEDRASKPILITFEGPQSARFVATVNGERVILNLIKVSPQEDINDAPNHLKG